MNFKRFEKLFEIDASMVDTSKMGISPFTGGHSNYEVDDNLFTPDNAELELISQWVTRTAGMFWAFKKSVRDALFHKTFIDAIRYNRNIPVFSKEGKLDKNIVAYICRKLRVDVQQCSELIDLYRQDLRIIVSQLNAAA